jgi:uncharacterized protein involved in type VI secretion and phage assembly
VNTFRRLSEIGLREDRNKIFGVVVGIVTNNKDPDGKYRVKVRFPWLPNGGASNSEESAWCRIATFMAGGGRGAFFLPEVDDEVLIAFEHGDIARPYVVGALWNGTDKPTYDNKGGKNNVRGFTSRSGHVMEFCDDKENKKEKITIKSSSGARIVVSDEDQKEKTEIYDAKEDNYVLIDVHNKKITIETKTGDMLLKCKETFTVEAKNIKMKSDECTTLEVGKNYDMKAQSNMTLKASGTGDIESSGAMTIKGSKVNIN